jgi:methyltransferase
MRSVMLLVSLVAPLLLFETVWSRRNERRLRARGAIEPADDVYRWMRPVYPGMFLAMAAEGVWRGPGSAWLLALGVTAFLAAKVLKWSAIVSLGELWSFRVLVLPGVPLVRTGPYRYLRHPNYLALVGEILGAALMWRAWVTGLLSAIVFGALLRRRIAAEEAALGLRGRRRIGA